MSGKRSFVLLLVGLLAGPAAGDDFDTLTHKIPPGYEPGPGQEEQGLWSEVEYIELEVNKSALLMKNGDLVSYINTIVCRVAGPYCNDLRVYVIRNPEFNAFMMPNGMMEIWTGLILRASSTDELAAVIGHEIAHYTRLHTLDQLKAMNKRFGTGVFLDLTVIATGVGLPVGQYAAWFSVLAFSRDKETEADILGVKLMASADYDPHASYLLWGSVLAEREAAVAKGLSPPGFISTHPPSRQRARRLRDIVTTHYGPSSLDGYADAAFIEVMNSNYMLLMNDQLATNRYGRTLEMLERHEAIGIDPSLVRYFYGETYRQRGSDGDRERAVAAYQGSIEAGNPPPEAYRDLGYLLMKQGNVDDARDAFRQYLELASDPTDRAMIEFYLEGSS